MMGQYKAGLRAEGVKPPVVEAGKVNKNREYRKVPEERLTARLGLTKYDVEAPLDDTVRDAKEVKILLSQHIGAPAKASVKEGQSVKTGDCIAKASDGLSVSIHSSIDGKVKEVTEKYIILSK